MSIPTVVEAIEQRRSIRRYTQEPIPQHDLEEILRLAGLAPSAFNLQPWRFFVVSDGAKKGKLLDAAFGQKQVESAPAIIVVASDMADAIANPLEFAHPGMPSDMKEKLVQTVHNAFTVHMSEEEREQWGSAHSYIALGFLLLAAQGLGYGTSPMLGFDPEKVRTALGLKPNVRFPALVAIGRPAESGFSHHRHPVNRIATFL